LRGLAILAIAVVLVDSAGQSGYALLDDLHITGSDGEAVVGLRSVDRGLFRDRSCVGVPFAVVVVIGVRLHIEDDVVRELFMQADVLEVSRYVIGVVLIVEVVDWVRVVGEEEVET
jgi:hypothetical protein